MNTPASLHITFLADWHVGEGAGAKGYVDAIVRRDPGDNLPYLPAKTVTGILRDGCERIAYGLDEGDPNGPWLGLVKRLFGSNAEDVDATAQAAALAIRPARFAEPLRQALRAEPSLAEALTKLKPGVALDAGGVARGQMLRFEEVVMAGAELEAPLSLALEAPASEDAWALIAAGARAVERLGNKRRRGLGRCRMHLAEAPDPTTLRARLANGPRAPAAAPPAPRAAPSAPPSPAPPSDPRAEWATVRLELELVCPVVVPAASLGNVVTTRDHIPGSLLLPAFDGWLRQGFGPNLPQALANGAVQLHAAYPAAAGERLLPVPHALHATKEGAVITNHLITAPEDNQQRKQLRHGYVTEAGVFPLSGGAGSGAARGRVWTVETLTATHTSIADEAQRPTEGIGGVFSYTAIRPDQPFQAELRYDPRWMSAPDPQAWLDACPEAIRIGRSKKDDYGQVRVIGCDPLTPPQPRPAECLTLWLTAPCLLRDAALAYTTDPEAVRRAIEQAVNAAQPPGSDPIGLTLEAHFHRLWRDEGWNNAWQMHRPTRFGLAPGSCYRFRLSGGPLAAATLARLEAHGLGERRGEGYGALRCNPLILAEARPPETDRVAVDPAGVELAAAEGRPPVPRTAFTHALQERAARQRIQRAAITQQATCRQAWGWQAGRPTNSQLGGLRAQLEAVTGATDLDRVRHWLDGIDTKRAEQWPEAGRRALRTHLTEPAAIWHALGLPDTGTPGLPGHDPVALAEAMRPFAIATLWLTAIGRQLEINQTEEPSHGPNA